MRRFLITAVPVFTLLLAFPPVANADAYVGPVYKSQKECNHDAILRTQADGGALSGHYYYCKEIHNVPGGTLGCDNKEYGCRGNYYELWRTDQN